jgi:hypothetical protein
MISELEEIKRLLHFDWDPIGVAGAPEALDEYDSYAFRVFVMLNENADARAIADYLDWVVTERMEMPAPGNSAEIAARIISLHLGHTRI